MMNDSDDMKITQIYTTKLTNKPSKVKHEHKKKKEKKRENKIEI